jgi:hypothetical protein
MYYYYYFMFKEIEWMFNYCSIMPNNYNTQDFLDQYIIISSFYSIWLEREVYKALNTFF